MNTTLSKRTFSITNTVIMELERLNQLYDINKATFIRMAVYHGIEMIKRGYRPFRPQNYKVTKRYDISLPMKVWYEFDNIVDEIQEEVKESLQLQKKPEIEKTEEERNRRKLEPDNKLTRNEIIESFIRIEISKYSQLLRDILNDIDAPDEELLDNYKTVSIDVKIPGVLYNKLCNEHERTGLAEAQLCKYHLLGDLVNDCQYKKFDTIYTDADVAINIEALGLPLYKTLTLITNLVQSGKFVYKKLE